MPASIPGAKEGANLDQWANGPLDDLDPGLDEWQNGNLNAQGAHYFEGDFVPYRTTMDDLDPNKMYWLQFEWDTSVSSGNVGIGVNSPTSFKLQVAGHVGPNADDQYDLGSNSLRWRDLYLGPTSLHVVSTAGETTTARDWNYLKRMKMSA